MKRIPLSRTTSLVTAAALICGGLTAASVGAAGGADAATCSSASRTTKKATLATHNYSESVTQTAGALAKVTYTIDVGTSGAGNPYVNSITDTPPAGFGKPTAKVRAYHFLTGLKEEAVPVTASGTGWKVSNTGWSVTSSHPVTASFTYDMPLSEIPGFPVTSGGIAVTGTVGVDGTFPGLTACFLTRPMSPGEAIGSVSGDLSSSGSTQDIISEVVAGLVGGVIGGIGSGSKSAS
ncbi:hypothetical protein ACK8HH_05710 [Gordonia sp. LUNF6]|uniref:hypothetical protein n=1 Tax=Gordonia sp. LUNF6 TaxID=3388658 RepID=UPI003999F4DB